MDNSKMSGPSEESKGFIDNELINQDDHQNSHQEEVEDHIIKIQNGENESDDDNNNDERNELMGSHDNDNPTLLPENDLESEAHRKQKQENFIDFEQELYDDENDKTIDEFEKHDKNKKVPESEKRKSLTDDSGIHQDFQSNIFMKKLVDDKIEEKTDKRTEHPEEETKGDPDNNFLLQKNQSEEGANSFDNLQYGSQIILNIEDESLNQFRKLSTKLRISEKCIAEVMGESEYNINCLFKVIPSSQFIMQDKILTYIEEDQVPMNIDVEFENFSSEVISNSTNLGIMIGKSVKYEETFQLYQESSKRFLAFFSRSVDNIEKIFANNLFSGDECYYLGFSEYPGSNTHFKFETVASYQSEIDGFIKRDHSVYLTAYDQIKNHYLHCINSELVLTETHKTPITFKVIKDSSYQTVPRTVAKSNVFLLSFANDNYYLNVQYDLSNKNGEYYQKGINFNKWSDINSIDFNGWWQIEAINNAGKVLLRNFNTGKFLVYTNKNNEVTFDLTQAPDLATTFEFISIINDSKDVNEFTEHEIFKIKIVEKDDKLQNYFCIEESDNSNLYTDEKGINTNSKKCMINKSSKNNTYDSFKIIIPKEEKYMELASLIDSREYIQLFSQKLIRSTSNFSTVLVHIKDGLSQVFINIIQFIQNQLKGKIRSDYAIGQTIPHRQDMIVKVGMLSQIFKLLALIAENVDLHMNKETILKDLAISPYEFNRFENFIEVILKTIDLTIYENPTNIKQCHFYVDTIQKFYFVRGCTSLLINIFKSKDSESSKKEIHSDLIYKRIYEIEKFKSPIKFFTDSIIKEREHSNIRVLRKLCIINENPLPLVQSEIFDRLYSHDNFQTRFKIFTDNKGNLSVKYQDLATKETLTSSVIDLMNSEFIENQNFLLEQLTLEADLCYGRNDYCKSFIKELYPCKFLISCVKNSSYSVELRGVFMRLMNYIYIDDYPHKLQNMQRTFKAYESSNHYISGISSDRSEHLSKENLDELITFIKDYIHIFATEATGASFIKTFDLEIIRTLRYLLRFGLFIYRNNTFQTNDVDFIFSYLCHLLDFYTGRNYIKSVNSLDKIVGKDNIQADVSQLDPFGKVGHDIKYRLFNKNYSVSSDLVQEQIDYKSKSGSFEFTAKLLKEIIFIFHFFNDMRQHYLMTNCVEFFYKEIYEKSKQQRGSIDKNMKEILAQRLINEFSHIIPDSHNFHNHLDYVLPSIDKMYEKNEIHEMRRQMGLPSIDESEMHTEYISLLIDTFNIHNFNPLLGQLSLLLLSRYYSENAEFIRNLDKIILLFDENEWKMNQWIVKEVDQFVLYSEKSNIWFMKINDLLESKDSIESIQVPDEVIVLDKILKNLKTAIIHDCIIGDTAMDDIELDYDNSNRKINVDAQNLYRNLKVYDYLIEFLDFNKEFWIKIRSYQVTSATPQCVTMIRKILRRILKVLEFMTKDNRETQELMWKYKEEFTMKELGNMEQEGELDLVLAIIDDSTESVKLNQNKWNLTRARYFVNCLRSRMNNQQNFVVLLEIFNKLIKFEAVSFLKQPLTKLVLDYPDFIITHDKDIIRDFIRGLNTQEIIFSVICNQQMKFMRKFLKTYFPYKDMISHILLCIKKLDQFEHTSKDYTAQDIDELRDDQYIDLVNIYIQVYLNPKYSDSNKEQIAREFVDFIAPAYLEIQSNFNSNSDFKDMSTFHKSALRFYLIYMQNFIISLKRYLNMSNENFRNIKNSKGNSQFVTSFGRTKLGQSVISKIILIEELYSKILKKIENSHNDELDAELQGIYIKNKNDSHVSKREGSIKVNSSRTAESINFEDIWREYISSIVNSNDGRKVIDREHNELVNLIFNTITNENSNPLTVESFKKFLSASITFIYTTEKSNSNLFIIIFVFKLNSMLLKLCNNKLSEDSSDSLIELINSQILDSIDTLRISYMIFKMLSNLRSSQSEYTNEVFSITTYFLCSLLEIRPESIQEKFLGFFQNDSISQNFFRQCYEFISLHRSKLISGVLKDYYSRLDQADEISQTCYTIDKNLEKQVINLLKLLCIHDNTNMQNYMRFQDKSIKSYNLVILIADYVCEFKDHLQYPVAYDTFITCLDALIEFIQGPNYSNQEILIQRKVVDLCNNVLKLEYRETNQENDLINNIQVNQYQSSRKVFNLSHDDLFKKLNKDTTELENSVLKTEYTQPETNFMISLVKLKSVTILLQLLVGRTSKSYVYYLYRRIIDPELFRLNLAYVYDFFTCFHNKEYTNDLFFKYTKDLDAIDNSPLIIELGFRLYFLLMSMKDSLDDDMDEKYLNRILVLLCQKDKSALNPDKGLLMGSVNFFTDLFKIVMSICRAKENSVIKSRVYELKDSDMAMRNILKFFADHSSHVEVLKDNALLIQYFPILPYCKFSSEEPKETFMDNVNRTNSKTKCDSLLSESEYLIIDLKVNYWLTNEHNKIGQIFQKHIELWKDLLLYFCFFLNAVMLASYSSLNGSRTNDPNLGSLNTTKTKALLYAVGGFTLFLISAILINIFASKIPIHIRRHQAKIREKNKKLKESGQEVKYGGVGSFYSKLNNFFTLIYNILTDVQLLYFIGLLIMTILGLAINPFFYTYLISYLIYKSPILLSVLQSIWIPRYSIGLTIALLFMVVYAFTIFSYKYYYADYPDHTCYNLWTCYIVSYDQTFKAGSGIGPYLGAPYVSDDTGETIRYGRVIFDNLEYIIINVLLLGIISGIIIDTFSELRQKNYDRNLDSISTCFICEKSREDLEKKYGTNGFEFHVNSQHNIWDYLFFIAYLHTKMESGRQLNTIERYTYQKIESDDQSWFPCYA